MERIFILLPEFDKACKHIGITDEIIREIEEYLCIHPESGSIIQGTGGIRKLRWALPGKGKSGGARIIYIDFIIHKKIYFITAYRKNDKENLTKDDRNILKSLIAILEEELSKKKDKS
ncbi:MAG: addiction module toxin RelE [Spirochaetes bacterium]|nr:MAG: addiction module toxin RelE [Spirochaetota bacterium]